MDDAQLGWDFGEALRARGYSVDLDEVRADARELIELARTATAEGPWDEPKLRYNRILFPNLVSWLPDAAERDQLCFEFAQEVERLERLLAAA